MEQPTRRRQPRSIITRRRPSRRPSPRGSFLALKHVVYFCLLPLLCTVDAVKLQGGSALALAGKGCVVLAMDQRVGTR